MRAGFLVVPLLLAACSDEAPRRDAASDAGSAPLTTGEERARIAHPGQAITTMRSGPNVAVQLPHGFTLYPGAKVISNTLVAQGGRQHMLLVFQTTDPVAQIVGFYRTQAQTAGASIAMDLGGDERASIGGTLSRGAGTFTVAIRRDRGGTRVEFAVR